MFKKLYFRFKMQQKAIHSFLFDKVKDLIEERVRDCCLSSQLIGFLGILEDTVLQGRFWRNLLTKEKREETNTKMKSTKIRV